MDERSMQLRVGIVVISALLLTAILILLMGDFPTPFQSTKTFHVNFSQAPGVTEGTPVRKSGILIGRVTRVEFRSDAPGVRVTVQIRTGRGVEIYDNETFQIKGSLLGDAVLEVVPINGNEFNWETPPDAAVPHSAAEDLALDAPDGTLFVMQPIDAPRAPQPRTDGEELSGRVVGNPLDMVGDLEGDVRATLNSIDRAGDQVAKLAETINALFDADDREPGQLLEKAELAVDQFNQAMQNINRLLGDEALESDIRTTIESLPLIVEQTQAALSDIQNMVQRADRNLQNLEGLTGPLGEQGPEIARQIDSSLGNLEEVLGQLNQFSRKLNEGEGTLAELINNPDLYQQINSAATNINQVTTELRPIVNDIRVLSDKLSRDPGQLGVRGALRPNARTKYPDFGTDPPPPTDWRQPLDEWPRYEIEWYD